MAEADLAMAAHEVANGEFPESLNPGEMDVPEDATVPEGGLEGPEEDGWPDGVFYCAKGYSH